MRTILILGNCLAGGLAILLSAYLIPHLGLKLIFFGSSNLIVISALLLILGYNLTAKNPPRARTGSIHKKETVANL